MPTQHALARGLPSFSDHPTGERMPTARAAHVSLALLALALSWTLAPMLHGGAPYDNAEELVWAGSLEWGYYKHPPLPTWIIGALVRLFGRELWLTYAAGMACACLALWFMWRLGCEITTPWRAAMATAWASLIAYHSVLGLDYNHNTVQLAPLAAFWWCLYRVTRPSPAVAGRRWGLALGVCAGLALLTKYSALVQFVVAGGFVAVSGRWRDSAVRLELAIALLVCTLLVAPHAAWVLTHPQGSLGYARAAMVPLSSPLDSARDLLHVGAAQFTRLLPMLAAVGLTLLAARFGAPRGVLAAARPATEPNAQFNRRFVRWAALGPMQLALAFALTTRTKLSSFWLSTFFLPWGLLALEWLAAPASPAAARLQWRYTMVATIAIQLVMLVGHGIGPGWLADHFGRACRANLPAVEVSQAMQDLWHRHQPASPLAVVAGETWFAGSVAVHTSRQTMVLIDGDLTKSPWLDADRLRRCGALVLLHDTPGYKRASPTLDALYARTTVRGTWQRRWTQGDHGPELQLRWGIVPAQAACT